MIHVLVAVGRNINSVVAEHDHRHASVEIKNCKEKSCTLTTIVAGIQLFCIIKSTAFVRLLSIHLCN